MGMGFRFQMGMGMGMKSLKWEGIGTKNLFSHTSSTHRIQRNVRKHCDVRVACVALNYAQAHCVALRLAGNNLSHLLTY